MKEKGKARKAKEKGKKKGEKRKHFGTLVVKRRKRAESSFNSFFRSYFKYTMKYYN